MAWAQTEGGIEKHRTKGMSLANQCRDVDQINGVPSGAGLDLQCLAIKAGSRKNMNCLTPVISARHETLAALEASVGRAPSPRRQA